MPRSDVTTRTATRLVSVRSVTSGWVTFECVATADTARVSAREYGVAAVTRSRALPMREAAMSSIARKIFFSDSVDRIRCR
jgi:hypothetical protein